MKIKIGNELLPLNLLVVLLIVVAVFFPSKVVQIILGLPFVLFLPGYVLMAALFPKKEGIGGIERLALSFGVSIAVVPLIGLALNYTPWGIRLEPILYSIASFIFITSIIASFRRKRLSKEESFSIEFHLALPTWKVGMQDRVLSIILGLAILGAVGTLGYVIAMPRTGESFTEFYVLGSGGEITEYPRELKLGEEGKIMAGIINQELETVSYRVVVSIEGVKNNEMGPIVLEHGETWEEEVGFVPRIAGTGQYVEFFLYKNGEVEPCLEPLHLWLDVKE